VGQAVTGGRSFAGFPHNTLLVALAAAALLVAVLNHWYGVRRTGKVLIVHEDSLTNILLTIAMYFTYCQFWLYVVFKALILDALGQRMGIWDKTIRYEVKEGKELDVVE
jgi:hypothetical protein